MFDAASETIVLTLADGLTAYLCPKSGLDWLAGARTPDTAIAWCVMTWPPEGRTGMIARLALRTPGDREALSAESGEGATIGIAFVATGEYAAMISRSGDFYLPEDLAPLIGAAVHPTVNGAGQSLLRHAKCLELASGIFDRAEGDSLVPQASTGRLSQAEMERLIEARRIITTRFDEKLTLDLISRAVGLNRAKLTQGFREVFGQTVADCLGEQRLMKAASDLRSTSRPVSTIGYSAGYLNNASFARAFSKRFGICPTSYRRSAAWTPVLAAA